MGYRSQVVLAVSKEVLPQFLTTLARSSETKDLCFVHADKKIDNYDERGGFLFFWDHVKWYDSYEEMQAITDFMDWCDDENDEDYRFVRAGESMDDNESRGFGFDDIHITRELSF